MNQSKRNGKCCYYCRRKFNDEIEKTKDHVVAKSKGGLDNEENYADCCFECNQWKGAKTLADWLKEVEKVQRRGKHLVYTKIEIGQIIGNIKKLMNEIKHKTNISVYKPH